MKRSVPMDSEQFNFLPLLSVPSLVRFDPSRKERTLTLAQSVAEGFNELKLGNSDLAARYKTNPEEFVIRLGDLNEQGLAFARSGFQRWLANTDRWTGPCSLEKFKSALAKQWGKGGGNAL
jgi:hypothetical protein